MTEMRDDHDFRFFHVDRGCLTLSTLEDIANAFTDLCDDLLRRHAPRSASSPKLSTMKPCRASNSSSQRMRFAWEWSISGDLAGTSLMTRRIRLAVRSCRCDS